MTRPILSLNCTRFSPCRVSSLKLANAYIRYWRLRSLRFSLIISLVATSPKSVSRAIGMTLIKYVWMSSRPCFRAKSFRAAVAFGFGSTNWALNFLTKSI